MIRINKHLILDSSNMRFSFITSSGPGGQNVNKVATGVLLRFNIYHSSLPDTVKTRLNTLYSNKISKQGELIIKAFRHRTQARNKQDAIERLCELIKQAAILPKKRKKTKPSSRTQQNRLDRKKLHSIKKSFRRNKDDD